MKRLAKKHGLSIMVLADSIETPHTRDGGEADLRRSRILCSVADTAIHLERLSCDERRLSQTRSQLGEEEENTVDAELKLLVSGLVGLDLEFVPGHLPPETIKMIARARELRESGMGIRKVAAELGISKSSVSRYLKKWSSSIDEVDTAAVNEREWEREDREIFARYGIDGRADATSDDDIDQETDPEPDAADDAIDDGSCDDDQPLDYEGNALRSIYQLQEDLDPSGRTVYVESRDENTGQLLIWYTAHHSTGVISRHERTTFGVMVTKLDSEWICISKSRA